MYFASITIIVLMIMAITCAITQLYLEKKIKKKDLMDRTNIIVPISFMWIIGFVCSLVFSVICILAYSDDAAKGVLVVFGVFIWLGISLMIGWLSQIIIYDDQGFVKGWLPGWKKRYLYKDFTAMKKKTNGVIFYIGKKKISFDYFLGNAYGFTGYAIKRNRELTGKFLPNDKRIPKWDVFKGHVESPESFIFVGLLMMIFTLSLPVIFLFQAFDTVTEADTIRMEITLESYVIHKDTLVLNAMENDINYEIYGYESCENILSYVTEAIQSQVPMQVEVLLVKEDDESVREYDIYSMKDMQGNEYVTYEIVNRAREKSGIRDALISCSFFVVWMLISLITIYVGRNPHKFSKRVQGWFFKDGYIKG